MQSLDDLFKPGPDRGWMRRAACVGFYDLPFPELPAGRPWPSQVAQHAAQVATAKAMCSRCTVRVECLDYALAVADEHGIWGGLDEEERRALPDDRDAA